MVTPFAPFEEYSLARAKFEEQERIDPVPEGWEERHVTPPVSAPPVEQPSGLKFRNPGCRPDGGPSAQLLEQCGLTTAAELVCKAENAAEMAALRAERALAAEASAQAAQGRAARDAAAVEAEKARAKAVKANERAEQLKGDAPTAPATDTAKGHANAEFTALVLNLFHFFFPLASAEGLTTPNVLQIIVEGSLPSRD